MNQRVRQLLAILESHGSRIHVLLTRLTMCESTAEDLLQELFLRLSKSESFGNARDQTAYAIRTATNLAFEWRRIQQKRVRSESLTDDPVAPTSSPDDSLERRESCAQVLHALDQLSEISRQVIVLHRLEEQSYESIAAQLQKTPHQVRAICSKGVAQLRQILADPTNPHLSGSSTPSLREGDSNQRR
ncbi:MAG: sigma-70 family RNA polymerase sigma factor [Pirellulaceae bacterium]